MSIDPNTNDYVPGGTYVCAPGNTRESGTYALAMAMATHKENTGPPDWSPGTLERRYYDALEALQAQYIGYEDKNYLLTEGDLVDIIRSWGKRYRDKYQLYIDDYDDIYTADEFDPSAKIVLVRCINNRWEACCYFDGAGKAPGNSLVDQITTMCLASKSSAGDKKQAQTQHNAAHRDSNGNANGMSETVNAILSRTEERCASMETHLSTLEKHINTLEGLCVTLHKHIDLLEEAGQTLKRSINNVESDSGSVNESENALTPSTLRAVSDADSADFPW
ncbi:hypothetical protein KCU64_g1233, partial [Aureobasidium melanogenum]